MEIVFVYPRLKMMSGGEHLLLDWVSAVLDAGHELTVLTRGVHRSCLPYIDPRARLVLSRRLSVLSGNKLLDSGLDLLYGFAAERRIPASAGVVVFWNSEMLPALYLSRRRRRAFVSIFHCLQRPEFVYGGMWKAVRTGLPLSLLIPVFALPWSILDRWWAAMADVVVTISTHNLAVCKRTYRPRRIVEIPPAVRIPDLSTDEARARHHGRIELLSVGKLIAKKNFGTFIGLVAALRRLGFDVGGTIVGGGPLEKPLRSTIRSLGLSGAVELTGYLDKDGYVEKWYQACDIYVCLEKSVPFGLTALEASARCKPVIAVAGGGADMTVVNGVTGVVVPDLDLGSLVQAAVPLLKSADVRDAMGLAGREHAKLFSREVLSGTVRVLFEEVSARRFEGLECRTREERDRIRQLVGSTPSAAGIPKCGDATAVARDGGTDRR